MNLAYLFPASAIWEGIKKHPCRFYPPESPPLFMADAAGGTPFYGVLHHGDLGHFLLVGPPGSGKSTGIQLFVAQMFRYPDARVFLFEKGYSGYTLANANADVPFGAHYDIGGEEYKLTFAPLADVDRPVERMWAEEWLTVALELQGVNILPRTRTEIREALNRLGALHRSERTMTMFANQLQDVSLREAIEPYTLKGNNPFLDGKPEEEGLEFARYTVFEMEHLMELGDKHVVPILLYLFHRIEKALKGEPALVILDEAWLMLLHPLFRERIRQWLKTFRKANVGVGFATQEVADLANSPIRDVIFSSMPTKILLANPAASSETQRPLYRELGLNDQEIDLVAAAVPKRDYYYTSPYGKRLFSLSLGPMCLAFAGVSGKDEVRQVRELIKKYGPRWTIEWTHLHAGAEWAKRLAPGS
jgi:type IV secretion system protein VirB4